MTDMLLKNKQIRRDIVNKLNKMIDLPWISEKVEGQLISIVVNACFDALTGKKSGKQNGKRDMPGTQSRGAVGDENKEEEVNFPAVGDAEADEKAKQEMVDKINKNIDVPLLNEEQEAEIISKFVDVLFSLRESGDPK